MALQSDAMSIYKPDWREAKARMLDWWSGKRTDRVVGTITSLKQGVASPPRHGTLVERYTDFQTIFHNLDAALGSTFHGAEAFPHHFVYVGAVPMGAYLGCELEFRDESVWQSHPYEGHFDRADEVNFNPSNKWWQFTCALTQASLKRAKGRYLVTASGGGELADVMANLFGSEEILIAMLERPAGVRRLRDRMLAWTQQMHDEMSQLLAPYQHGYIDWLRMWAPGTFGAPQVDLSVMVSKKCFDDLWLEEIRNACELLDHVFYHLDGSGEIQHLDSLLSLEKLAGIQWVPEPNVPSDPVYWIPMFRKIQAAGKKLFIYCRPDRIEPLLNALDRRGVFLSVSCEEEAAAREAIRTLERIGT
jgi:hypothetical protein